MEVPNLPSRVRDAADALQGRQVQIGGQRMPARVERAVREGVAVEHGRGIVQAARADAVHYVAQRAGRAMEDLTELEALAIQRNPLAEGRLKAINDTATAALAHIVAETGQS
jgi:hypothetical protein